VTPEAVARAAALLGGEAAEWARVENRISSPNERWLVRLADGRSAFAKAGFDEQSREWIRAEHRVYAAVEGSFMPRLLGFDDGLQPLLVIEDLSGATWPPPWTPALVEGTRAALVELAATPPPPGLPPIGQDRELADGWERVAADPEPFLSLGLCSRAWLDAALPALRAAAAAAELAGDALLHVDVRSDNLCLHDDRVVLVDWNQAAVGNPLADAVFFAPSLAMEGGPPPEELVPPGAAPGLVALIAGFLACRAGLPAPDWGPHLRPLQLDQLEICLPWAARELSLPAPS
jgi:aminoglycoside phosphotransferase (APT) family kinase protein